MKKQWKRAPRRRATAVVNKALAPVPQRWLSSMKYSDTFNLDTNGSTSVGTYRFRLNSIYDPNLSGGGHQPYGRDTFASLYNRYRVYKCDYVINVASSNAFTVKVAALPSNEADTVTTTTEALEKPRCRWIVQAPNAPSVALKGSVYLPSLYGRTKSQMMADDRYQSAMDASPSESAILNIFGGLIGDAAVSNQISCTVTLTYHYEMFDPIVLAQS